MNDELLPCPNGHETARVHDYMYSNGPWVWWVRCDCDWRGPERPTEAEAVAAWNTRPEPSPPATPPELAELIWRLRALSRHEHDDHSVGEEAADELEGMTGRK
jgi:hypothetical protein